MPAVGYAVALAWGRSIKQEEDFLVFLFDFVAGRRIELRTS